MSLAVDLTPTNVCNIYKARHFKEVFDLLSVLMLMRLLYQPHFWLLKLLSSKTDILIAGLKSSSGQTSMQYRQSKFYSL